MLKPAARRPMASGPISSPTRGNAGGSHQLPWLRYKVRENKNVQFTSQIPSKKWSIRGKFHATTQT